MNLIYSREDFLQLLGQLDECFQQGKSEGDFMKTSKEAIIMAYNAANLPYYDRVYTYFTDIDLSYFDDQVFKDIRKSKISEGRIHNYQNSMDAEKLGQLQNEIGFYTAILYVLELLNFDSRIGESQQFSNFKIKFLEMIKSNELEQLNGQLSLIN